MTARRVALLAPAAVLAAAFSVVRPTNFSGYDEWLIVSLASRGITSVPYANRPLVLLWAVPGALGVPHDLRGLFLAHFLYTCLYGALTAWIASRLAPGAPRAALVAGVAAATWAPLDYMRLDTVLLTGYAGFTAAGMAAVALFVAGWAASRPALAVAGAAVAALTTLGVEGALPVLAAAPVVAWAAAPPGRAGRRRLLRWAAAWEVALTAAALPLLLTLARPGAASYQTSALGLDAHPGRLLQRVLRQFRDHLWPLVSSPLAELAVPAVAAAVVVFLLSSLLMARAARPAQDEESRRGPTALMSVGALLAALGWVALSLSPSVRTAARAQILSAPGVALLIAGAFEAVSRLLPARVRGASVVLAGAWMVAVGAGRTAAMQREWDAASYWPAQRAVLLELTRAAPLLEPNTLVVLLDEAQAFPATFTFHHAVRYLYGEGVRGHVWRAHEFLYPARFGPSGVSVEPWPVIRDAWRSPPTHHRFDELLVARVRGDGRLVVEESWPRDLPPLPPGAGYAPRNRVRQGPAPPARRILRLAR